MTRITENQWIEYFGFQRFPFDRPESGNEEFARPDFLASCFVEPKNFERILGHADSPATALLFAARGTGKTACRVMLDYYCQHGQGSQLFPFDKPSYVLTVPHIYLHQVFNRGFQYTEEPEALSIRVESHVVEIMARAVVALTSAAARTPEIADHIRNLSAEERHDLSWFVVVYGHYLSMGQVAYLNHLGIAAPSHAPMGFQTHSEPSLPAWAAATFEARGHISPLEHIAQWAWLMRQVGLRATYVLVDGVDEFEETANDAETAFTVIRPLLASLRLMDSTPYLAFKFFLPDNLRPIVVADKTIRLDRGFILESITWQPRDLLKILSRRLDTLKRLSDRNADRVEAGFDSLCVPDIREQIEKDLAHKSAGNPRNLMLLCGLMVTAHCAREIIGQDDPYQLTRRDWEIACDEFDERVLQMAPVLELQVATDISALIAQGENELIEFKSSAQWDYHTQLPNRKLREAIAKVIAGMLNSEGGILLIGVADDGSILGIEPDMETLGKKNRDGYQLLLADIISTYLNLAYMDLVRVKFEAVGEQTLCAVFVERSDMPVYYRAGDKYEFWVRIGNSTRELDVKSADEYKQMHFQKKARR